MTYFNGTAEFLACLNKTREVYAEMRGSYESDCASYSAQGYRAHYCIHGTDLWTDYDNICGGCEAGVTMLNMAVHSAYGLVMEGRRRIELVCSLMGMMQSDLDALGITRDDKRWVDWAMQPLLPN